MAKHAKGVVEQIYKLLPPGNLRIIDLGCGTFKWSFSNYQIYNCDIKELKRANFIQADLNKDFPFDAEEFDGIVAIELIEHLRNPRHFLKECKRILKRGGFIILTFPNWDSKIGRKTFLSTDSTHITPITEWWIKQIAKELNLKVTDVKHNNPEQEISIVKIVKEVKK